MDILNTEFQVCINGKATPVEKRFPVINPSTGDVFNYAPDCDSGILDAAVSAASEAFRAWADLEDEDRVECLLECSRKLRAKAVPLARVLTTEQGKPIKESMNEVLGCAQALRLTAELPLPDLSTGLPEPVQLVRHPLGVVAAITPWNFPLILAIWKIAPALRMGNTVVVKPSPHTPLSTLKMVEILASALPAGVLNSLSGDGELGRELVNHPHVRMVSFTGSVESGKRVAHQASNDLKRLVLELGGNDAAVILEDADPAAVAEKVFWCAFSNAGQFCTAIKRLFIHESLFGELSDILVSLAEKTRVGPGIDPATQMGPLTLLEQRQRIEWLVDSARETGGTVLSGGSRPDRPGFFYPPTLIAGLPDDHPLVAEEQFGPVLPILSFRSESEVMARANNTAFGLGGSVWSANPVRASALAAQLEVGVSWVNNHGIQRPDTPLGGWKCSGLGYANGSLGLGEFCRLQTLHSHPGHS